MSTIRNVAELQALEVMTTYFHNFAPADAVQYDGTPGSHFYSMFSHVDGWLVREYAPTFEWPEPAYILIQHEAPRREHRVNQGQWLVRQGSRVWVQDEEPARVERWEFHPEPLSSKRRPRLTNGWVGPYTPTETKETQND